MYLSFFSSANTIYHPNKTQVRLLRADVPLTGIRTDAGCNRAVTERSGFCALRNEGVPKLSSSKRLLLPACLCTSWKLPLTPQKAYLRLSHCTVA